MIGRPSKYTPELATIICEQLMDGVSLRRICAAEGMPSKTTVMRWALVNADFRDQYRIAREMQADTFLDDQIDIADEATPENWQVKKLQADTRKWVASKLAPKKYGDKVTLAGDGENPINTLAVRLDQAIARTTAAPLPCPLGTDLA